MINNQKILFKFIQINENVDYIHISCSYKLSENFIRRFKNNVYWGLSHNIIFPILFSKDLKNCPDEFRLKALILNIVSIVSNLREPLLESNIKKAINEIELFGLNSDTFLSTISNINDNIKSNS
jgi:hypothetical protein